MGRTVSSPDGNRWYVRRAWLPWRFRWRGRTKGIDAELRKGWRLTGLDNIVVAFAALVVIALSAVYVIPALVAVFELFALAVLLVVGVLSRVVLRRPWIVEATPATGPGRFRWKVVGWRRSAEVVDEVALRLEAGERTIALTNAEAC